MREIAKIIVSILICFVSGFIGTHWVTQTNMVWYDSLIKPVYGVPQWLYMPVWSTLFIMLGIALYTVWEHGLSEMRVRIALGVFFMQLLLKASWPYVFFGVQWLPFSFLLIVAILVANIITAWLFWRINRLAGYLVAPSVMWSAYIALYTYVLMIMGN